MKNLTKFLENKENILIVTHIRPDGDAVGSVLGTYLILKNKFPKKRISFYFDKDMNKHLYELSKEYVNEQTNKYFLKPDVLIALDCGSYERLALPDDINPGYVINIDHHITNNNFGDINIINNEASATSEILCYMFLDILDSLSSQCFLLGICTDTGFFRNDNVTVKTMNAVKILLEKGAILKKIVDFVENRKTYEELKILSLGINRLEKIYDGFYFIDFPKTEWMKITDDINIIWKSGIFHQIKGLVDCKMGVYLIEKEDKNILVEFRSKDIDCSKIAIHFGGGGHKKASGCAIRMPLNDAKEKLKNYIKDNYVTG